MAILPPPPHKYNDDVFYNTHHLYNEVCGPSGDDTPFVPVFTAFLEPIDTCPQAIAPVIVESGGPCVFGAFIFGQCSFGG